MTLLEGLDYRTTASTLATGSGEPAWRTHVASIHPAAHWHSHLLARLGLALESTGALVPLGSGQPLPSRDIRNLIRLLEQLSRLLALDANWDDRSAEPLDDDIVAQALPWLADLVILTDAPVELFPLPDGGLQAEWHFPEGDLEVQFDGDGDALVLLKHQGERFAGYLEDQVQEVRDFLLNQLVHDEPSSGRRIGSSSPGVIEIPGGFAE